MTTEVTSEVTVVGLGKSYGDLPVLRGVDFEIPAGTIFALLGSNGAGKTTVVRILSTLLDASRRFSTQTPETAGLPPIQAGSVDGSISR